MSIIAWIVLGAIAGYLAGFLVRGDEGLGVIGHIVLGIVGVEMIPAITRKSQSPNRSSSTCAASAGGWISFHFLDRASYFTHDEFLQSVSRR